MYRLLLTLCLGEFVFPAIDTAAAAPPATSCALYAQQGGGLAERFKQLDRNGDGKLSREEAGSAPFFRAADKDGDGFLTFAEAEAHARQRAGPAHSRTAGMEGDGAGRMTSRVRPVAIPETESPIQTLEAKAADGRTVRAFWRKPKSEGTLPAIVFIHGGLTQFPEDLLRRQLLVNPVITRMLAAGYAVAQATFRTYEQDVQSRGPIEDVRAVVRTLAETPGIDGQRIALFGGSGGGSIALELGGDPAVRAIVAGEPATVLYTGMLATGEYGPRLEIMANPEKFFTPELRERTRAKLKTVRAPVLILHGDRHDLHKLNAPLFVPMMKEAGVRVEYREYPGYGHGFYFGGGDDRWGKGADDKVVAEVVQDVRAFLEKEIPADDRPPNAGNHQPWVTPPVRAPGVDFRTFETQSMHLAGEPETLDDEIVSRPAISASLGDLRQTSKEQSTRSQLTRRHLLGHTTTGLFRSGRRVGLQGNTWASTAPLSQTMSR